MTRRQLIGKAAALVSAPAVAAVAPVVARATTGIVPGFCFGSHTWTITNIGNAVWYVGHPLP